jgi:hypothetical protein
MTESEQMPESITSERRLSAAQKRVRALELRRAGKTFEQIASEVGYRSKSSAHDAVMKGLHETLAEPADELRSLEAERLNELLAGLWEKAKSGDLWAVDRALSIMERRAKLFGLDRPPEDDLSDEARKYLDMLDLATSDAKDMSE